MGIVLHRGAHAKGRFVWELAGTDIDAAAREVCRLVGREGFVDVETLNRRGREKVDVDGPFVGVRGGEAATIEQGIDVAIRHATDDHVLSIHYAGSHHAT